jgi:hypothetical protein
LVYIEKVTRDFDNKTAYRFRFDANGYRKESEIVIDNRRLEEYGDRYLEDEIHRGLDLLFQGVASEAFEHAIRLKRETGSFDNTAGMQHQLAEQTAMREARFQEADMHRLRAQQMAQAQMATSPLRALGGLGQAPIPEFSERVLGEWRSFSNPKQDKINEKAMSLLKEKIGKVKFKSLEKKGYFEEKGKYGKYRFYKNDPSGVRFIQEIDAGGKKRPLEWTLCIQSSIADMPKGDVILARWMEFKADEEKFRKTANWRDVRTKDEALT